MSFSGDIWFKIVHSSEKYISPGALVPSYDYILFMESSGAVFPAKIILFASEIVTLPKNHLHEPFYMNIMMDFINPSDKK